MREISGFHGNGWGVASKRDLKSQRFHAKNQTSRGSHTHMNGLLVPEATS